MQLKKINQDHYIVVTDEPIKEGDWIYWNKKLVLAIGTSYNSDTKKVTHSTSNIGGFSSLLEAGIKELDLSYIKSLVEKTWDDFGVYMFDTQPKDTWECEFDENNNLKLK